MKPVSRERLDQLAGAQKSVVIVNKTCIGSSYVKTVVYRSVSHITTKECHRQLPMELWLSIIDFALEHPRRHEYALAWPRCVENSGYGPTFVCDKIQNRELCGSIEDGGAAEIYQRCLDMLDGYHGYDEYGAIEMPFDKPVIEDNEAAIKIPAATLDSKINILFERITIPDIISRLEDGQCRVCNGRRLMCAGCGDGLEAAQNFRTWLVPMSCTVKMVCPLCIGEEYTEESLRQNGPEHGGDDDDFVNVPWRKKRLRALGYPYPTF